jgi:uncharacterized protein
MMQGETNLSFLIKNMQPILNEGQYIFSTISNKENIDFDKIILFFKEKEGFTIIVEKEYADVKGYAYTSIFAWITLLIHSALDAVGLTAAFSNALAEHQISCNIVAGLYHDHIFVQQELGQKAVAVLQKLSQNTERSDGERLEFNKIL